MHAHFPPPRSYTNMNDRSDIAKPRSIIPNVHSAHRLWLLGETKAVAPNTMLLLSLSFRMAVCHLLLVNRKSALDPFSVQTRPWTSSSCALASIGIALPHSSISIALVGDKGDCSRPLEIEHRRAEHLVGLILNQGNDHAVKVEEEHD